MKISHTLLALVLAAAVTACGEPGSPEEDVSTSNETIEEQAVTESAANDNESFEITPGLKAKILKNGHGRAAEAGDMVDVHYTGWLFDGEGRVIQGWDQGVVGMLIGEKRELTIAPEMGYGDRGAGNVIPPGATLIFEVELFGLMGPADSE